MKTYLYILMSSLLLMSCQKKHCWECTIDLKNEAPEAEIICNANRQQIKEMQESWERHPDYENYECKKTDENKKYCWSCDLAKTTKQESGSIWTGASNLTLDTCGLTEAEITSYKNHTPNSPKVGDTVFYVSRCELR